MIISNKYSYVFIFYYKKVNKNDKDKYNFKTVRASRF
jgi:hypothetical protein